MACVIWRRFVFKPIDLPKSDEFDNLGEVLEFDNFLTGLVLLDVVAQFDLSNAEHLGGDLVKHFEHLFPVFARICRPKNRYIPQLLFSCRLGLVFAHAERLLPFLGPLLLIEVNL